MKFKSVLGAILFVTLASFLALVLFVQTKSFGALLTKVVTDLSQRKIHAKISIKNVELSLFPPGLELNKVAIERKGENDYLSAEFGQLGFYVSLIEIEERRLSFGEIRVLDSVIDYNFPEKDEETKAIEQKVIDEIFDLSEKAPVRVDTLIVENSLIHLNYDLLEARRLKVFKKGEEFIVRFHLSNIKPSKDSEKKIDEVWGDLEVGRKNLEIYRLKVQHDVQSVLLKGYVDDYRLLKGSRASLKGEAHLHLRDLDQELGISNTIRMHEGFADLAFNLEFKRGTLTGNSLVDISGFRSSLAFADKLEGEIRFNPKGIELSRAHLTYQKEDAVLLQPVQVFQYQQKIILPAPLQVTLTNYTLTNALRLAPDLKPLRGELTGRVTFRHDRGDFYIKPHDGFMMNQVSLIVGEQKPFRILTIKSAQLKEADIAVVEGEVRISSMLKLPRSSMEVDGFVNKKKIRFSVIDAQFDLEDLGNIANLDIKGAGPLSMDVTGGGKDVAINLKGKLKGFEVLGYKLGQADTNITVDLGDDNVTIHKMESRFGSTPISVTGAINYDNLDIALGINSPATNYHEISEILDPIFKKMDFLPKDFNFNGKVDANVYGKTRLKDLKVKSTVNFTDLFGYGENINAGSVNINMNNEVLTLDHFSAEKGRGQILGDFKYLMNQETLSLDFNWENIDLTSLNISKLLHLNLDGKIVGTLKGGGKTKDYDVLLKSRMFETKTQGYKFKDSNLEMHVHPDRWRGEFSFLGDLVSSEFDMSLDLKKGSDVDLHVAIPEIKPILVALLGQHIESEPLSGRIYADLSTDFMGEFRDMDLTGHFKEIYFEHPEFKFNYQSATPDFIIKDNLIKHWAVNINQPDVFVKTSGEGSFGKKVSLINEIQFNAKLIEILFAPVLSADGFLRNQLRIQGNGEDYSLYVNSTASKINLSIQNVPFPINDLDYDINFGQKRLEIKKFQSALETGTVSLQGDIFFDDNAPDVNLKYVLDRAEIPILGKSSLNITGEGIVIGNELPYNVTGDLLLNKALIVNEIDEFSSSSAAGFGQIRYLPKNQENIGGKLFNLNVNVKADSPIRVNNSLMDVALRGEVRLFGNPTRPRGEGRLYAPVNSSRVFFKNNEYTITSADINFLARKDIANPDFDIQAMTTMSNYKVYAKAYGDLERLNFDLTSDPALPRNSILSLIAFGYTDEIGTLRPEDQQSLTQMGMGSLVIDQFKVSDILNKQFGVQVNVGATFVPSEQSLLSGRAQSSSGGPGDLGRTRSATKVELKKRLNEATTLAVSSTVGGYIGSRQSMNLNYSVNRKVQLEGIYEVRSAAEGEYDSLPAINSVGGDLKFRWSFK